MTSITRSYYTFCWRPRGTSDALFHKMADITTSVNTRDNIVDYPNRYSTNE